MSDASLDLLTLNYRLFSLLALLLFLVHWPLDARPEVEPGGGETRQEDFRPAWPPVGGIIDAQPVGHEYRQDDMPSLAAAADGSIWLVWVSFDGKRDDLAIRRYTPVGGWQNIQWVPGASGDIWQPQVAVDKHNAVWVVWSQQVDGNWDIYSRCFRPDSQRWDALQRLTTSPLPDINPCVSSNEGGHIALAWQAFRHSGSSGRPASRILLRHLVEAVWSEEVTVTSQPNINHWDPVVALDREGSDWIAFDSYVHGNYDLFLSRVEGSRVTLSHLPVTVSPAFEARASLAVDSKSRVWIAWEQGLESWGRDQGRILGEKAEGTPLGGFREAHVAVFDQEGWSEPEADLASVFKPFDTYHPQVFSDGQGSVWVVASSRRSGPDHRPTEPQKRAYWEYWVNAPLGYWEYSITHLEGDHWSHPAVLPHSKGRLSTRVAGTLASARELWLTWPTDNRNEVYYHRPVRQQVFAGSVSQRSQVSPPLRRRVLEEGSARRGGQHEPSVVRIRNHRVTINGKSCQILRGDLHRHTELSWDEGGRRDGSLPDFYRYVIDVAALDFATNAEHQAGLWPYWQWYSFKMTDLYHVPGLYTGLFGFERSASFPFGHRNVYFEERSRARLVPFFLQTGVPFYSLPLSSEGDEPADESVHLAGNDTELLWEEVKRLGGITIPHTTATGMGTDWHYPHDEQVEPVVEIFQGARRSYEQLGAPYAATPDEATESEKIRRESSSSWPHNLMGVYPEGMVSKAWKKGYRLGVIASSDHISTHISYAMVYTPDPTRHGIVEALRRRHAYAATDNIVLEVWIGDHFMGDEFTTGTLPPLRVRAVGTAAVERVDILRDSEIVYTQWPAAQETELLFDDRETSQGSHYYYVRLLQEDGMIAWSSPIWVTLP